jgi:hypothetical protein
VKIVDQDLLSQIPQKDARIIGGKRTSSNSYEQFLHKKLNENISP